MKKRKIIIPIFLVFLFWTAAVPVMGAAKSNIQFYNNEKNEAEEEPTEKELYKQKSVKTGDENNISILSVMVLLSVGGCMCVLFSRNTSKE